MTVCSNIGLGMCEGVSRDSSCRHEESNLMHDT